MGWDLNRFQNKETIDDNFQCPICHDVLKDPMMTVKCGHVFCSSCISQWVRSTCRPKCPIDNLVGISSKSAFTKPPSVFMSLLGKLNIKCQFENDGCKEVMKLSQCDDHTKKCQFDKNKSGQINETNGNERIDENDESQSGWETVSNETESNESEPNESGNSEDYSGEDYTDSEMYYSDNEEGYDEEDVEDYDEENYDEADYDEDYDDYDGNFAEGINGQEDFDLGYYLDILNGIPSNEHYDDFYEYHDIEENSENSYNDSDNSYNYDDYEDAVGVDAIDSYDDDVDLD